MNPIANVYKVNMAFFFKEKTEIRSFGLISSLYAQLKDVFKTEPQSIPVPDDAPADVPRCVWNDVNTSLSFNKMRLDFSYNVPTKYNWDSLFGEFNEKISKALEECELVIDRVGLITEMMSTEKLQVFLTPHVNIDKFNCADEANISWLEKTDSYNVWTYFIINESKSENKIIFDINTFPDFKLSESGISSKEAMSKCAEKLRGKMLNVL